MRINLRVLFIFISSLISYKNQAQELNAIVKVQAPNLTTSDKSVVQKLENAVKEFLNNTKWTNDRFEFNERIKCNFQITIREDKGGNVFSCDFSVQATRPVFQSAYETQLFVLVEKDVPITFDPFKPLENSKENYFDNLSSILTFYAYFILALDYDSFALEGGDPYISILRNMIDKMPQNVKSYDKSWTLQSKKKNNRYSLMDNLTNPTLKPFRRAYYEYHRLCLDKFSKDVLVQRPKMIELLETIVEVERQLPNSYLVQLFINAKSGEIRDIFVPSPSNEKSRVYIAMTNLDPANSSSYNVLK